MTLLLVSLWLLLCSVQRCGAEEWPIAFIHITKTGGTALDRSNYGEYLRVAGHSLTMRSVLGKGDHKNSTALAIIREPTDRFLSIFKYWKYGSDLYNHDNCREVLRHDQGQCPPSADAHAAVAASDAEDEGSGVQNFIRSWGRLHSARHLTTSKNCSENCSDSKSNSAGDDSILPSTWPWYMWEDHFLPQTHWLDERGERRSQVVLVRFSAEEDVFSARIHAALSFLGAPVPAGVEKIDKRNVSRRTGDAAALAGSAGAADKSEDEGRGLTEEGRRWLRDVVFADDFLLWEEAGAQATSGLGPWKAVF